MNYGGPGGPREALFSSFSSVDLFPVSVDVAVQVYELRTGAKKLDDRMKFQSSSKKKSVKKTFVRMKFQSSPKKIYSVKKNLRRKKFFLHM